jgi:hypothetical protein
MKSATMLALSIALACGNIAGASAAELPAPFKPCVAMRRDAERLACFDRAAAAIESGTPDASATSPEDLFGTSAEISPPGAANSDNKRDELKRISGAVASTRRADDGMIALTLDNGQVWRQQDGNVTLTIEPGDTVTVVRASMGTFRITDKRGRSARFRRLR